MGRFLRMRKGNFTVRFIPLIKRSLFVLLISAICFARTAEQVKPLACDFLLSKVVPARIEKIEKQEDSGFLGWSLGSFRIRVSDRPSAQSIPGSLTVGRHGFPVFALEKVSPTWVSEIKHAGNNHGDPLTLLRLLGTVNGKFFSLGLLDARTLLVPGAQELNASIEEFNSGLPDQQRIGIHFFSTSDTPTEGLDYLERYVNESAIPLAEEGFYQIHDIGFHVAAMFFPVDIIQLTRSQYGVVVSFLNYLKSEKKGMAPSEIDALIRFVGPYLSSRLDTSGNIHRIFEGTAHFSVYELFYNSGRTPLDFFNSIVALLKAEFRFCRSVKFDRVVAAFLQERADDLSLSKSGLSETKFIAQIRDRYNFIVNQRLPQLTSGKGWSTTP